MAVIIGCVSQKGGVGKGATARGLAVEAVRAGLQVEVVDMDTGQATLHEWAHDRAVAGLTPAVKVRLSTALGDVLAGAAPDADVIIIDGPAKADDATLELLRLPT